MLGVASFNVRTSLQDRKVHGQACPGDCVPHARILNWEPPPRWATGVSQTLWARNPRKGRKKSPAASGSGAPKVSFQTLFLLSGPLGPRDSYSLWQGSHILLNKHFPNSAQVLSRLWVHPKTSQQTGVYPYPLGAEPARPNQKMGAPDTKILHA